jgi:hypothetical protein
MNNLLLDTDNLFSKIAVVPADQPDIMPSETSFADRIGRFVLLKEACESMSPAFAPPDTDIALAAQTALIMTLNTCCNAVMNASNDLKDLTDPRAASIKVIKERVTRAVSRVASNRAWASKLPAVKAAADKVRGVSPPKSTAPAVPADPDAPVPKTRDRGGRSYKDIEGYLFKFIGTLQKCTGYETGAPPDITIVSLQGLQVSLKAANEAIPDKQVVLQDAQVERLKIFESKKPLPDGSHSLRDRWVRIKKAVAAQYGRTSTEYELVRGIKY